MNKKSNETRERNPTVNNWTKQRNWIYIGVSISFDHQNFFVFSMKKKKFERNHRIWMKKNGKKRVIESITKFSFIHFYSKQPNKQCFQWFFLVTNTISFIFLFLLFKTFKTTLFACWPYCRCEWMNEWTTTKLVGFCVCLFVVVFLELVGNDNDSEKYEWSKERKKNQVNKQAIEFKQQNKNYYHHHHPTMLE